MPTICVAGRSLAVGLALALAWLATSRAEVAAMHNPSQIIKPGPLIGRVVLLCREGAKEDPIEPRFAPLEATLVADTPDSPKSLGFPCNQVRGREYVR